eukprot:gnl/MRDRNA2_/MRDRNA2_28550_c0_seq1.p1 gnl/MRDRNA2_/MRDRNA2_28550_c0~~gnl/MRDRNA2_/MRDRNA2_28550_c0_seq1.p1  ORF type:complete len:561 (+),score=110.31 gnl/MRDRNA2_/MRDRNA2_28550_c0_seq1:108-1790(+)
MQFVLTAVICFTQTMEAAAQSQGQRYSDLNLEPEHVEKTGVSTNAVTSGAQDANSATNLNQRPPREDVAVSPDGSLHVIPSRHVRANSESDILAAVLRSVAPHEPSRIQAVAAPIRLHSETQPSIVRTQAEPATVRTEAATSKPQRSPDSGFGPEAANSVKNFISTDRLGVALEHGTPVVLIYDVHAPTDRQLLKRSEQLIPLTDQVHAAHWPHRLVATGSEWKGWSSKVVALLDELRMHHPQQFVILSESSDILVNTHPDGMNKLIATFDQMTSRNPGAIVMSTEGVCCAAAMSHAGGPGKLIAPNGTRLLQACTSDVDNECKHPGTHRDVHWEKFFDDLAMKNGRHARFPYPSGVFVAGRAADVARVYDFLKAKPEEDDKALFAEAVFRRPDWVVLDYDQHIFGTNHWNEASDDDEGCLYVYEEAKDHKEDGYLRNRLTNSTPFFIHTAGRFHECYKEGSDHDESTPSKPKDEVRLHSDGVNFAQSKDFDPWEEEHFPKWEWGIKCSLYYHFLSDSWFKKACAEEIEKAKDIHTPVYGTLSQALNYGEGAYWHPKPMV